MQRAVALASIAAVGVALLVFIGGHAYSLYDDAYIYLRYVDHLFAGCGLRFNCGEPPVEGFTSPLWLALLAAGRVVTRDLETLTQVLGALSLLFALAITLTTAARIGAPSPSLAVVGVVGLGAIFALDPFLLLNAVSGLETPLAALLSALIVHAAVTDSRALGPLLVAGLLARPELGVLLVAAPLLPRARTRRFWLPVAAGLALVEVARALYFHDLAPNTFHAKAGGSARHAALGLAYLVDCARDFPAALLAPLALLEPKARRPATFLLAGAALWLLFFLRSGGDTFAYSRLWVPLVPSLTLFGVVGLSRLATRARAAASLSLFAVVAAIAVRAQVAHALPAQHGFPNVRRWAAVGRWLARAHPGAAIATVPIGAIGWFSHAPLLDLVGLTDRTIARGGRVPSEQLGKSWIGHEREDTDYVLARAPELLVFTKWQERPFTLAEARAGFFAEWRLLRAIKEGRAPYAIEDAEIAPGVYWLVFRRAGTGKPSSLSDASPPS